MDKDIITLKSGETIEFNKPRKKNVIKKRAEIDDMDTPLHILKTMIDSNEPLRCIDIAHKCDMDRSRIYQRLVAMIKDGVILTEEKDNKKYYYPQSIFWEYGIIDLLADRMIPIIELIDKKIKENELDMGQTGVSVPELVHNCMQISLRLLSFGVDEDIKCG